MLGRLVYLENGRNRRPNMRRVGPMRKPNHPDTIGVLRLQQPGELQCQTRLADASRSDESQESCAGVQFHQAIQSGRTPHEATELDLQVPGIRTLSLVLVVADLRHDEKRQVAPLRHIESAADVAQKRPIGAPPWCSDVAYPAIGPVVSAQAVLELEVATSSESLGVRFETRVPIVWMHASGPTVTQLRLQGSAAEAEPALVEIRASAIRSRFPDQNCGPTGAMVRNRVSASSSGWI